MGLLSNIGSAVKSAAKAVGSAATAVAAKAIHTTFNDLPAVFTHPITAVTKGIPAAEKQLFDKSLGGQVKDVLTAGATYATLAVAGLSTAGKSVVAKVAGKAATTTAKTAAAHPIVTAAVALPVATAVISNPKGAVSSTAKVIDAQIDLGKTLANPSIESAKDFITEHPIATAAAATAAAAVVAKTAIPAAASYLQTSAIKEQTEAIQAATTNITPITTTTATPIAATTAPTAPQTPVTPATAPLIATAGGTTSTTRRKKRAIARPTQNFKQQVSVIVSNRANGSTTKRYLNREILVH